MDWLSQTWIWIALCSRRVLFHDPHEWTRYAWINATQLWRRAGHYAARCRNKSANGF